MAAIEVKTFKDIVDMVREEVKIQPSDTITIPRIKRDVNMVYLNEVVSKERWKWARDKVDLTTQKVISTGTAAIFEGGRIVTLTDAPTKSVAGYFFSITSDQDRYRIAKHTANSTTVELETTYAKTDNATATFKIWTDSVPLPADCRETVQVWTDLTQTPMENWGLQDFRESAQLIPSEEGRPRIYTTNEYVDPVPYAAVAGVSLSATRASNGLVKTIVFASDVSSFYEVGDRIEINGSTSKTYNGRFVVSSVSTATITYTGTVNLNEATVADVGIAADLQDRAKNPERYRELLIHPAVDTESWLLHADYIKEVPPLEADADEPLMPIEDRAVLVYGALVKAWSRERNMEEAQRNTSLFTAKLGAMRGDLDDSTDAAKLRIDKRYLSIKRNLARFRFDFRRFD